MKPKKDKIKGVVYSIPCECGATYTGETGRNLHTRVQEHERAVCKGDANNGIVVHVIKMNHTIQWEKARTIATESLLIKRKVKESLLIRRTLNNMNLDKDLQLDDLWCTSPK